MQGVIKIRNFNGIRISGVGLNRRKFRWISANNENSDKIQNHVQKFALILQKHLILSHC